MTIEGQQRTERRLAAILAADVVGYSRLMSANEEGTHVAMKAVWREVTDPRIDSHRGRIVKTMGDGLLVEFASVVDAVRCAVDIQRAMASRNVQRPAEDPIVFRIGINVGDIIIDGADIFGDGVNVAARLEGLAAPGGICVSRIVRDQVRDKLGFGFEDLGQQQVKNISRPVHVFRIPLDDLPPPAYAAKTTNPHRLRFGFSFLVLVIGLIAVGSATVFFLKYTARSKEIHFSSAMAPSPTAGDPIVFDRGGIVLPRSADSTIDGQALFLRDHPRVKVKVKAYCADDEGARETPMALAQLRANKVQDALKARGISGDRIETENDCKGSETTGRPEVTLTN
jgi:class 3 adenylate cyclase